MNEAFEKILDRLIIMRDKYSKDTTYDKNHISAYNKALKIVHEVAEEYKDKYVSKDEIGYMLDSIEMRGDETWMDYYRKALKSLCKLTNKEYNSGWIPCNERLPKERDWCLAVFEEVDTGFIGIPYIAEYLMGNHAIATTEDGWIIHNCTDIENEYTEYYKKLRCVAWQPLPEPYKAESEVEKNED